MNDRSVIPIGAMLSCILCSLEEDTVDHLMSRCQFWRRLWDYFLKLMSCKWVFTGKIGRVMEEW